MTEFGKNVVSLALGNIIAQSINFVAVPIITRIYSPEEYGIFGIYLSCIAIMLPLSTLSLQKALMLPDKECEAAHLLGLSFLSVISITFIISSGIFLITMFELLPQDFLSNRFINYIWLVPFGIFLGGCLENVIYWAIRHKKFRNISVGRVLTVISEKGVMLSTGYFLNAGAIGLIIGTIIGLVVGLSFLIMKIFSSGIKAAIKPLPFPVIKGLHLRYKEYCFFSVFSEFILKASVDIPLILLAMFFSTKIVGLYLLANRVVRTPVMLVGDAISRVFFQKATEEKNIKSKLSRDTFRLFSNMINICLPCALVLLFFGENIFAFLFGADWALAGKYAQILCLSYLFLILYRPLGILFDAYERNKQRMVFSILLLVTRVGSILLGVYISNSIFTILVVIAVTECIIYAGAYVYTFGLLGIGSTRIIGLFFMKITKMAPLILSLSLAGYLFNKNKLIALITILSLLILQVVIIAILKPEIKKRIVTSFYTYNNRLMKIMP